ncbi:hypothetical protein [Peptostreptococcus equinus]|uniref:Uncharacterized protein n=1 Tax=Peptostreptococcus equinus TaxID=3003601 RepID=A0ABY7JS21_9FIRM|nr:hypothetical protein [Peptostreptococcus sp. CBA3647]WAW14620.1 hypothetical protein O0R46_08455 [Peptostreptococcus sp. CBA3647]WAW15269.1 hypothetical protein O0R46_02120 [Peptostreptococcus sp. CBA3647]
MSKITGTLEKVELVLMFALWSFSEVSIEVSHFTGYNADINIIITTMIFVTYISTTRRK